MTNREILMKRVKWKKLKYAIVLVIILILVFIYFPRNLGRVLGVKDVLGKDISSISLSFYMQDETLTKDNITNEAVIKDVISILSNQTMRRKVYGRGKINFLSLVPGKPMSTSLYINFKDTHEIAIIQIHHHGKLLTVNGTRYSLYWDGIDTIKLLEIVSFKD